MTTDVVVSRAATIASLLSDTSQLSLSAIYNCSAALISTISEFSAMSASDSTIETMLLALSAVISNGRSLPASVSQQISKAIDILTAAHSNSLVPGESTTLIVGNVRFYAVASYVSQASQAVFYSPQTALEKFLHVSPVRVSFSSKAFSKPTTKSTTAVATALHSASNMLSLAVNMGSEGDPPISGGAGVAMALSLSQTNVNFQSGRPPNSTAERVTLLFDTDPGENTVVVTLQNEAPIEYDDSPPQNGSVACRHTGFKYSVSANCTSAPDINVTCHGNDTRRITYVCPGRQILPQCLAWNGEEYVATEACTVISYTPYNTTCSCVGDTGYDSELGAEPSNNPQIDAMAASADIIVTGFTDTWESAREVTPSSLYKNKVLGASQLL